MRHASSSRRAAWAVALVVGPSLLVGCGDNGLESDAIENTRVQAAPASLTVVATDIAFDAEEYAVPAGEVAVTFVQEGALPHILVLEDDEAVELDLRLEVDSGQLEATGTIGLDPGTYTLWCSIPGHRALGQEAVLVVS